MKILLPRLGVVAVLVLAVFALVPKLPAAQENEACGAGFWRNHLDTWKETVAVSPYTLNYEPYYVPYRTLQDAGYYVGGLVNVPIPHTLLSALSYKGGPGLEGAVRLMVRESVVALLNASHPDVNYGCFPGGTYGAINVVNYAINVAQYPNAEARRQAYLEVAAMLQACNEGVCPL